ncbi:unnamed protein product [Tuber melanosporum]|uniref:(Perigord truffle) hypothetical protein n=1 Tax=Tuber melanosporum (strain Mel28) TaxID=656061 RepID=D5GAG1_TUBMM|nr:uncharacterized protein GSTUM_00005273001 [Tuber melanosporum]CAZ81504.1 unnamed protein product [Tuber melanosporum]
MTSRFSASSAATAATAAAAQSPLVYRSTAEGGGVLGGGGGGGNGMRSPRNNMNGGASSAGTPRKWPAGSPPMNAPPESPLQSTSRRNSLLPENLQDATKVLVPLPTDADSSPWHNVPLAFALLPALGGILFTDGSYFFTDVILIFLVAVFLHWLVKFPWEWYGSSQALRYERDAFEALATPVEFLKDGDAPDATRSAHEERLRAAAARELRMNEVLALLACFVGPCVGGSLLHAIRSQLSRPSEGLVSNFNLTIFVLAAELRPAAQVVKLIRNRSLYLHSVVHHPPMTRIDALTARLEELSAEVRDLTLMTTKAVDRGSHLDALTRAVRRYEKRETVHSAQTENRILEIDNRLNDVLTLTAAASARQNHTTFSMILFEWACAAIVIPFSLTWKLISLPAKAVETLAGFGKNQKLLKSGRRQQPRLKGRSKMGKSKDAGG